MLRHPLGRRRLLIVVAAVLGCLYAFGVFAYVLSLPDIGLRCALTPVVNFVYTEFLYTPEGRSLPDLRNHTVVQIGNRQVETWPQLLRAPREVAGEEPDGTSFDDLDRPDTTHVRAEGTDWVRVKLLRPDGEGHVTVWCRLGRSPLDSLLPSVLWFLLKAGLFAVGAIVYWKRPDDASARQFFILSLVTFGAYMGGYQWTRIATQPTLILVFMVCSVLVPPASLHFYLVFPRTKVFLQRHPRWPLLTIYGVPALFLLVLVTNYFRVRWVTLGGLPVGNVAESVTLLLTELKHEIYVYFGVAALLYLASIVCLVHSFSTAEDLTERNQVKWILFGASASLVPIGYTLYLAFWHQSDFGGGKGTWPMFAASVCVTTAFIVSITRYRLMQLDQIVSSGFVYFALSFLAGLVYYTVVVSGAFVFSWWTPASLTQAVGVSIAALVLLLLLDWLRSRLKKALDRRLHKEKHQLDRTLRRLSQAIDQLVDPPTLARRLLHASADLLGVPRGAVYLRDGQPPVFRLVDALGPAPQLTELSPNGPLVQALESRGTLVAWPRSGLTPDMAQRQLHFAGAEVAQAVVHEGQLLALLLLGPKERGSYGTDDLNLLAAFAQLTALALESARGHQTIEALNGELRAKVEKISEQQQRILALQSQLMNRSVVRRPLSVAKKEAPPGPPPSHGDGPRTTDHGLRTTAGIVGSTPQVRLLLHQVRKVAASGSVVLIRGESGTGKELLARALHENSPRAGKPFVKVHCAALSPGLLESELFGHVKGAFTGAHRDKVGRFELAHGGTLFLDEVGDITLEVQTKLLRVLQEKMIERVGSSDPLQVDVRVITATHQDLEKLIAAGRFREDLYYRLNVISVTVPALRDRREDVAELAEHFLQLYAKKCGKPEMRLDDDVLAVLKAYAWPGNIRQMENVIERAVVIAEGTTVTPGELPPELLQAVEEEATVAVAPWPDGDEPILPGPFGIQAERAERDQQERERLEHALTLANGNKAEAARTLGLARSTFLSRLQKHGIQ